MGCAVANQVTLSVTWFAIPAESSSHFGNLIVAVSKSSYDLPIATYMKEYRVHQAMKLLRETDATIADIAAQVGYETQGKFSKAFKDVTQVLPTEYRKMQY